uniref:Cytochrome P450 monooxygenase AufA n=2 Tax=Stigmatella aurantiaca TaxID=41 RepID=A8YP90_STIAU|nr:cytochrome P450 monooxygenase AufA [Stigmatella aurantiaca DW4/3-1]
MSTTTPENRDQPQVAPFILNHVGDISRPRRGMSTAAAIEHLPGEAGIVANVRNTLGWMRRGNEHLLEQHRRFGPVYRTVFAGYTVVCVADPEMVMSIARDDHSWSTALAWLTFFQGIDAKINASQIDSPLFLDFKPHRDARKILQPAFGHTATAGYFDAATPIFEKAIDRWVEQGHVSFKDAIRSLLVEVSTRIFLGVDSGAREFERALIDYWEGPLSLSRSALLSSKWRRSIRGHRVLCEMLRSRIAERRATGGDDLFSRLCAKTQESEGILDDDGLVRLVIGVMAAAFATTSSGLASMAYLLAIHPEWQEKMREEALAVSKGRVSYEDSKQLEVTSRVWKETMRLYPIAPYCARRALHDVNLGQFRIPAGTFVMGLISVVMQDSALWSNPQRFDPDRFTEERAEDKKSKASFLPFGTGAHTCTGMHLANAEAKSFWHAMLTRCRFTLERNYRGRHTYMPAGIVSGDVKLRVERL